MEPLEPSNTGGWNIILYSDFRNSSSGHKSYESSILILEVYPREMKHESTQRHVHPHTYTDTKRERVEGGEEKKGGGNKKIRQMNTTDESLSRVYGSSLYYSSNISVSLKLHRNLKFLKGARISRGKFLLSTSSMKTIYSLKVITKL